MDSENSTVSDLKAILNRISYESFIDKEVSEQSLMLLQKSLTELLQRILQVFKESSVSKYEVSKILEVGIKQLSEVKVDDKKIRQHTANYLKEIVQILDLDEEFRLAVYLWPIQD